MLARKQTQVLKRNRDEEDTNDEQPGTPKMKEAKTFSDISGVLPDGLSLIFCAATENNSNENINNIVEGIDYLKNIAIEDILNSSNNSNHSNNSSSKQEYRSELASSNEKQNVKKKREYRCKVCGKKKKGHLCEKLAVEETNESSIADVIPDFSPPPLITKSNTVNMIDNINLSLSRLLESKRFEKRLIHSISNTQLIDLVNSSLKLLEMHYETGNNAKQAKTVQHIIHQINTIQSL